jgi:RNA polymerase sigma-70 factor (ECF subfamily)
MRVDFPKNLLWEGVHQFFGQGSRSAGLETAPQGGIIHGRSGRVMENDDEVLVRLFRTTRDVSVFAELFRRHSKTVYYGCLRVVRNPSVAEDLTQDTFVRAFAHIDRYVEQCFAAWLKRIARNLCLNWLTSAANRQSSDFDEAANRPGTGAESGDRAEEIESAILQLSSEQRRCVELFYYEGRSYGEIVSATGMTYARVKSHLQNGMRLLRIHFNQEAQ